MAIQSKTRRIRRTGDKNPFTIPRRLTSYVFWNVLIIAVVILLALFAFLMAMHAANIYILVTEGVTLRSACVLGDAEYNDMFEYFSPAFMASDKAVSESKYLFYDITAYDYRLEVNSISLWPWDTTATMTVTERIPLISGTANANAPSASVPQWTDGKYVITCIKVDDRWYINEIILVMENPPDDIGATPNMSLLPSATPHVSVTPQVSPSPQNS